MSWFGGIFRIVRRLFSPDTADRITSGVQAVSQYLPEIYQVVEWIARSTPNRTDDELLAVAERLGVPAIINAKDRGAALAEMVTAWAQRKWPDVPVRRIRRAIEIAYGAIRP